MEYRKQLEELTKYKSKEWIAGDLGVSLGSIQRWLTGKNTPNSKYLPKIEAMYEHVLDSSKKV